MTTSALLGASALAAAAGALAVRPPDPAARRARQVLARIRPPVRSPAGARAETAATRGVDAADAAARRLTVLRMVAGLGVLGLALTVVGGVLGVLVGVVAAWLAYTALSRAESPSERRRRDRLAAESPMVADLLAACLDCGATPARAVGAVAEALGPPWRDLLLAPVAAIGLGADPVRAWRRLADDAVTAPLADVLARGADDGVALVPLLRALAVDRRRERRAAARRRAQHVGVAALGPLGACFLPAFVLVGVVPVVVSVGRGVLGGLV